MIERCEANVRAGCIGMQTYYRTCGKPATHQEDGKFLCAEHAQQHQTAKQTEQVRTQMQRNREGAR